MTNTAKSGTLRRTGIVGVVTTSALAVAVMASTPAWAADATLESAVDSLKAAQQATVAAVSASPYGNSADRGLLPQYAQNIAYFQMQRILSEQQGFSLRYADMLTAPGAEPRQEGGAWNPDSVYHQMFLNPNDTYVLKGKRGDGTNLSFSLLSGLTPDNPFVPVLSTLTGQHLQYNADGSYTITLSATPPANGGNWIQLTPGSNAINIRDIQGNWAGTPDNITITNTSQRTGSIIPPRLTSTQVAQIVNAIAGTSTTGVQGESTKYQNATSAMMKYTNNSFLPTTPTGGGGALQTQATAGGGFKLQPGQALVVAVPAITAQYRGVQLADAWGQTLPYAAKQTSLNNSQSYSESNGMTYYVVSATDPGVPNWLDSSGYTDGQIVVRWQDYTGTLANVQTQVVNVADVRSHLPADTPVVSPELRAEQLSYRARSVQNQMNLTKDSSWVTLNLQIDDIKGQLGKATFDSLFGPASVPALSSRLGIESAQQTLAAALAVLRDPGQGVSALLRVLPQAINQVTLPTVLAVARVIRVAQDIAHGTVAALRAGDPLRIVNVLGKGVGQLGSVAAATLFDPQTSITAGILNARDVLTFAVTPAPARYSPTSAATVPPSTNPVAAATGSSKTTSVRQPAQAGVVADDSAKPPTASVSDTAEAKAATTESAPKIATAGENSDAAGAEAKSEVPSTTADGAAVSRDKSASPSRRKTSSNESSGRGDTRSGTASGVVNAAEHPSTTEGTASKPATKSASKTAKQSGGQRHPEPRNSTAGSDDKAKGGGVSKAAHDQ